MSVNIKVTGGLNIESGQIDPKATGGLKTLYPVDTAMGSNSVSCSITHRLGQGLNRQSPYWKTDLLTDPQWPLSNVWKRVMTVQTERRQVLCVVLHSSEPMQHLVFLPQKVFRRVLRASSQNPPFRALLCAELVWGDRGGACAIGQMPGLPKRASRGNPSYKVWC